VHSYHRFPFNLLSMQLLKVHCHSFFFIFMNFTTLCFQTRMLFRNFFPKNIIGRNLHVSFQLKLCFHLIAPFFNIFSRCHSLRMGKLKQWIITNWFNYLNPTIQLKTISNIYNDQDNSLSPHLFM
jgi:hypothetical protein